MRAEKESIVAEIKGQLEGSDYAFLADYTGMSVDQFSELRGVLADQQSEMHVVKNAFLDRAAKDLGLDAASMLDGPTVMVTGKGDVTQVAKALIGFVKQTQRPVVKGGFLEEQVLDSGAVTAMSKVPPREVLYGMLVGTLAAPMSQLVGVFQQKLASLVYVLKAVEEKKDNKGD